MGVRNKASARTKAARSVRRWISDKDNQSEWNQRFKKILRGYYEGSDSTIFAILSNDQLSELVATQIRMYVDPDVTLFLTEEKKAYGIKKQKQLETAISGLRAARDIETELRNKDLASRLDLLADKYSQALQQCKPAFGTKRRGRDRDQSILCLFQDFLESELQHPVTNKTIANLVNAGFHADDNLKQKAVNEDVIRKNLAHFKRNNPLWQNEIAPAFARNFQPPDQPETNRVK
jgi:hypothetical protein